MIKSTTIELGGFIKNRATGDYDCVFTTQVGSELFVRNRAVEAAKANAIYDPDDIIVRKRTIITTYNDWE